MNKRRVSALLIAAVSLLAYGATFPENGSAAAVRRASGITISPAFQEITLSPDKPSAAFTFSVTNNTSEPYEFALSVTDFGSLDESGGVLFIGEAEKQLNYRYGLSSWITLEKDRIVVEPKSTQKVPVSVINKESLSPGGHYGAVLITPTGTPDRPTKVQVNQVLSSLLFVKKEGGEVYKLGLKSYDVQTRIFTAPDTVDLRFQNAGNVHLIPRGTITITDPMGRIVKRGFINTGSAYVLPETFRQIEVSLELVRTAWIPGTYRMGLEYRFEGNDTVETRQVSFFYVNGWYVIGAVLALIVVLMSIVSKRFRQGFKQVIWNVARPIKMLTSRIFRRRRKTA